VTAAEIRVERYRPDDRAGKFKEVARRFEHRPYPVMAALRDPAGQLRSLPDPPRHELLVELIVLMDVEVARVLALGLVS